MTLRVMILKIIFLSKFLHILHRRKMREGGSEEQSQFKGFLTQIFRRAHKKRAILYAIFLGENIIRYISYIS